MAAAIFLLVVVVVIGGVGINLYVRSWVREEARRETRLKDPNTHTIAFAVPNGVDPLTVENALGRAGLGSWVGRVDMVECVLIECHESQREQVRGVLEGIPLHAYDGSQLQSRHVVFEDER